MDSRDTTIQVIKLDDTSSPPKKIEGHSGPILSISVDPLQKYFASAAGDGSVCIWSLSDSSVSSLVKKWEKMIPMCTDISLSKTLCRMDWNPNNGRNLAIPDQENRVVLYSREKWDRYKVFKSNELEKVCYKYKQERACKWWDTIKLLCSLFICLLSLQIVSVIKFSPCGKYITAGASDGKIVVWNAETAHTLFHYSSEHAITGLAFSPLGSTTLELYYADYHGRLIWLSDFVSDVSSDTATALVENESLVGKGSPEEDEAFNDGMDDLFDDQDDENENEISISKIKAEVGFIDDEYVGIEKATKGMRCKADDDDVRSVISGDDGESHHSSRPPVILQAPNPFTDPQDSFQPSSSPTHLEHRFMVRIVRHHFKYFYQSKIYILVLVPTYKYKY
jgi:chromosome transmission fidelity protein 4